jgi:hypothetical protein
MELIGTTSTIDRYKKFLNILIGMTYTIVSTTKLPTITIQEYVDVLRSVVRA